jgi:hypothetical protein
MKFLGKNKTPRNSEAASALEAFYFRFRIEEAVTKPMKDAVTAEMRHFDRHGWDLRYINAATVWEQARVGIAKSFDEETMLAMDENRETGIRDIEELLKKAQGL